MKRWGLIVDGIVDAVVSQPERPDIGGQWVECGNAGPGWLLNGGDFAPPKVLRRLSKLRFQQLLGDAVYLSIKAKAKTDPLADLWLDKFNMLDVEADGTSIDLDDPRTRQGLTYLATVGDVGLTMARVDEILGAQP